MIGSLLAGTGKSEDRIRDTGVRKTYRGMGRSAPWARSSSDRYFQEGAKEGEAGAGRSRRARACYKPNNLNIIHQLMGGLRSGMGYTGNATLAELRAPNLCASPSPASAKPRTCHHHTGQSA